MIFKYLQKHALTTAALSLTLCLFIASPASAFTGSGTGLASDPFLITNCTQLQSINDQYNTSGEVFWLANDIDCSDTVSWNEGQGFQPIGDFYGTLDGRGHQISGLIINRPSSYYVGLFGSLHYGVLVNIGMTSSSITGGTFVGSFVGAAVHIQAIGVSSTAQVVGNDATGGLFGYMFGGGDSMTISKSSFSGTVNGNSGNTGGFVGRAELGFTIKDSFVSSTVSGTDVGGFIGRSDNSCGDRNILRSYVNGSVDGSNMAGGFIGRAWNQNCSSYNLTDLFSAATLSHNLVGGFMGYSNSSIIINSSTFDSFKAGTTAFWGDQAGDHNQIGDASASFDSSGEGSANYLKGNNADLPLMDWDFSTVWTTSTANFPNLRTVSDFSGPGMVSNVTTTIVDGSNILVSWDPATTTDDIFPLTYYKIRIKHHSDDWSHAFYDYDFDASMVSTTINEFNLGQDFDLSVQARSAYGIGSPVVVSFSTPAPTVYEISSCTELQNATSTGSKFDTYVLTQDIDCTSLGNFEPLNWNGDYFRGTLNGQGRTISHLTINKPDNQEVGLFNDIGDGAVLENINFATSSVTGLGEVGMLAGYAEENITINNVSSSADIYGTNLMGWDGYEIGGLVGYYYVEGPTQLDFQNNHFSGTVQGREYIGGFFGEADFETYNRSQFYMPLSVTSTISNNTMSGQILPFYVDGPDYSEYMGGLVGYLYSYSDDFKMTQNFTMVSNTMAVGSSVVGSEYVGGAFGYVELDNEYTDSYINFNFGPNNISHATVNAYYGYAGGFIGEIYSYNGGGVSTTGTIFQSYADGNITASDNSYAGGLVGYIDNEGSGSHFANFSINDSYYSGVVSSYYDFGGLIGYLYNNDSDASNLTIQNSYAAGSLIGLDGGSDYVGGLVGYSESYLNIINSFAANSISSGGDYVGAVVGDGEGNFTFYNTYYDQGKNAFRNCSAFGMEEGCTSVNNAASADDSYFYDATNAPFATSSPVWDFTSVWQSHVSNYPTLQSASATINNWSAEYWNLNHSLHQSPVFPTTAPDLTREDSAINFDWGTGGEGGPGSPDLSKIQIDNFAARWTKTDTFSDGWYRFNITTDDGFRFYVDGVLTTNQYWKNGEGEPMSLTRHMSAGSHTIVVEYYEDTGAAKMSFSYAPTDEVQDAPVIEMSGVGYDSVYTTQHQYVDFVTYNAGSITVGGSCGNFDYDYHTTDGEDNISQNFARLPIGIYSDCGLTLTGDYNGLTSTVAIPSFEVVAAPEVVVSTCEQLQDIASTVSGPYDKIKLTGDINCSDTVNWNEGAGFSPINMGEGGLHTEFDGQGHAISGLTINRPGDYGIGLFGAIGSDGVVKNLVLSGGSVVGNGEVGALAGDVYNSATIINVTSSVSVSSTSGGGGDTGGLVGYMSLDSESSSVTQTYSNLTVTGNVQGSGDVGGIFGYVDIYAPNTHVIFDNLNSSGEVSVNEEAYGYIGGMFGEIEAYSERTDQSLATVNITNSHASGNVIGGINYEVGGFAGALYAFGEGGPAALTISSSTASGDVSGGGEVGGFIGVSAVQDSGDDAYLEIVHSSASGDVSAVYDNAGGFIGHLLNYGWDDILVQTTLSDDFATGNVSGRNYLGGFIGGTAGEGPGIFIGENGTTGGVNINRSYAQGNVTASFENGNPTMHGGFIGLFWCQSNDIHISYACDTSENFSTGDVRGDQEVGGLVGNMLGDISIDNSFASGSVTGTYNIGGLIGQVEGNHTIISHSYSAGGSVNNQLYDYGGGPEGNTAGGLIGYIYNTATVTSSFTASPVNGGLDYQGGFIGYIESTVDVTISNDYFDSVRTGFALCDSNYGSVAGCNAVNTEGSPDSTHFLNNHSVAPLSSWNFDDVWIATTTYPILRNIRVTLADTSAPAITLVSSTAATTTASITWTTDENSTSQVVYSPDTSFASSTVVDSSMVTSHTVAVTNLVACALYNYKVVSGDSLGNIATSSAYAFTTLGCSGGSLPSSVTSTPVETASTSTASLTDSSNTITVTTPPNFTSTSSAVTIQIKALNSAAVLGSIGTPTSSISAAASVVFDVKALIDSETTLDSFDIPVTISYHYSDGDISGLQEGTLWMYHYHSGIWSALSSCALDTAANTIICTTPSFSVFSLFGTPTVAPSYGGGGGGNVIPYTPPIVISTSTVVTTTIATTTLPVITTNTVKVVITPPNELSCTVSLYLKTPVKYGAKNNFEDVKLLQKYLNTYEGANLVVDGKYKKVDYSAIVKWQEKYSDEILKPWGLKKGTGYVYTESLKKIKQIHENACKAVVTAPVVVAPGKYLFKKDLKVGVVSEDVKQLQIFLNTHGYVIATDGLGSPGQETTRFGSATKNALIKFQEDNKDTILKPFKLKKGTGVFSSGTRAVVNGMK